jgi:hypothetical protein
MRVRNYTDTRDEVSNLPRQPNQYVTRPSSCREHRGRRSCDAPFRGGSGNFDSANLSRTV